MIPIVLPWTFVMMEAGVRNFKTKLSVASNILLFFIVLVFPIYYFFELLANREKELIRERMES